ncbi:fungal-specific transcription factor domain-containing protein [Xylogone sp. PMI_703]|nr:fungal-specific transcription factor domain-containing protein [Xylogone sp. PMI_703]
MPLRQPKRVTRSFSACWTCRRRRIKCDGRCPRCSQCIKHGVRCEGYSIQLVWVDPKTGTYPPQSRRVLNPQSTWLGRLILDDLEVDHLISDISADECRCDVHHPDINPFLCFNVADSGKDEIPSSEASICRSVSSLIRLHNNSSEESFLFHHFISQVASLMVPVDKDTNPWRSVYPRIALQGLADSSRGLYHALLAQSAFNVANLYRSNNYEKYHFYQSEALKQFGVSLHQLRDCLRAQNVDYNSCMATLYTLMIIGSYDTDVSQWRLHFQGAAAMVMKHMQHQPWLNCSNAWVISQSLALSFEIAQTADMGTERFSPLTNFLFEAVASKDKFGFTIGANGNILRIISLIRQLSEHMQQGYILGDLEDQIQEMMLALTIDIDDPPPTSNRTALDEPSNLTTYAERVQYLEKLHIRIFRNATIIYLHRALLNAPPVSIAKYISAVLQDTMTFLRLNGGSISMWPVFIAATEASSPADREMVRYWMEFSKRLGIQSRESAHKIIEGVWKLRDKEAMATNSNPDSVAIDWRTIRRAIAVDILLL